MRWVAALIALTVSSAMVLSTPVLAQGFFENLFGSFNRRYQPPHASSYADPRASVEDPVQQRRPAPPAAPSAVYCVRLCDGRYFPIQRTRGANPVELCNSFCPASATRVFSGSGIDHAAASDGSRYASLRNAFAYRERIVDNCTCNGRDAYGLVPLNAKEDPTLRAGDIVATNDGFVAYNGNRRGAQFTPIQSYRGLSREWRQRLTQTRIAPNQATPASPEAIRAAAAATQSERDRRAQLDR
jgi:hypothetical protein